MKVQLSQLGIVIVGIVLVANTTICPAQSSLSFPPFEQWQDAVTGGNAGALRGMYSRSPEAEIKTPGGMVSADADVAFWTGLKAQRLHLDVVMSGLRQAGVEQLQLRAEIHPAGQKARYFSEIQVWQEQGGPWRLVIEERTKPTLLQLPTSVDNKIYPTTDAHEEIRLALAAAAQKHERVLVVFGADWCYDCHVLDAAFHRPDLAAALHGNFEVIHVDVGQGDKNQDLMDEYRVPMKKGIPALAVLENDGKLLFSQQHGEFENARALGPDDLLAFLNKWKPQRAG